MSIIQLHDITAGYGRQRVLGPFSLTVMQGEIVVLIGKSGCGKSTLLSRLYDEVRQQAALVPQDLGLVAPLSVFHNVYMSQLARHASLYNLINLIRPFPREVAAIQPVLVQLAIEDKLWSPVSTLSGGQKQRVAIARALHQQAAILLADEPVSALDGPKADRVMACLTARYDTAVVALHDIELALRYGQRIIGIRDGQIALDQPSQRLSQQTLLEFY